MGAVVDEEPGSVETGEEALLWVGTKLAVISVYWRDSCSMEAISDACLSFS